MIYSTRHNKNTNEDPKTSVVFDNLMLLPDDVFWGILRLAASNQGILPEDAGLLADNFFFWPKWDPNLRYETGNSSYVEPDVFFRFENIDVIVEAKYSDYIGQYREEWEREFKAYLNEFEDERKKVVILAVGGNHTFEREPELRVGDRKCPIVKMSWEGLLKAVLSFEKNQLSSVENEKDSSMKRIIRNVEFGFQNLGIHKYKKKVDIKGLSSLYVLGRVFMEAISRETETFTLTYHREDMKSSHYGYQFEVKPKDGRRKTIWLSIALWINDQEIISIEARNNELWAEKLCRQIEGGKKFSSKYAEEPYSENNCYYFDAKEKLMQEFDDAETFDAQVGVISKYIDDVCLYYLN